MKTLECHSRGDKRFSPFCCRVQAFGVTDTIEDHYQKAKVFVAPGGELKCPAGWREAKAFDKLYERWVEFRLPNGVYVPVEHLVFGWYTSLWLKYLDSRPDLVKFAAEFDRFRDPFAGNFPFSQAKCVEAYAKHGRSALAETCRPFFDWLRSQS